MNFELITEIIRHIPHISIDLEPKNIKLKLFIPLTKIINNIEIGKMNSYIRVIKLLLPQQKV